MRLPNEFGIWYAKPVETGSGPGAPTRFNVFRMSGVGFNRCHVASIAPNPRALNVFAE